jgi:aminopeptidase N
MRRTARGRPSIFLASALSALLLPALPAGCGSTSDVRPAPPPTAACEADAPRGYDVTSYDLRGTFDWDRRTLIATVEITAHVEAGARSLELDSRVARVVSVHVGDAQAAFVADEAGGTLRVDVTPFVAAVAADLTISIAYEADTSPGLLTSTGRDGDPVTTRVFYTQGEPTVVARWMPGDHHPSDRARFSVALDVADDEEVVANGARVEVTPSAAGRRVIRYAIDRAIPTYTMALAAGQLEAHEADGAPGSTEPKLTVWHRRGAAIDADRYLAILRGTMRAFERRIGPYPFDAYAVALLPEYPGGMENASVTFMAETAGEAHISESLGAHELAHQWFGDAVTVSTWNDVWIKEGMATLLAEEAQAARSDGEAKGRLFGDAFGFDPADSIRDCALGHEVDGLSRYTSGPYTRAGWLLTQIRALVGDDAFFARLRGVISDHLDGTIDTDGFLAALAGSLDEGTRARLAGLVDARGAPALSAVGGGARTVVLRLTDPTGLVVAPFDVTVVDASGGETHATLDATEARTVDVPEGGYVAIDERDVHPDWVSDATPFLVPEAGPARAAFLSRSAAAEEKGLRYAATPFASAADLARDYPELDSSYARTVALERGCDALAVAAGADADAWQAALIPLVRARSPDEAAYTWGFGPCGVPFAQAALGEELAALVASPSTLDTSAAARLDWIASFDFGAAESLARLGPVATASTSTALRDDLVARLALQAAGNGLDAGLRGVHPRDPLGGDERAARAGRPPGGGRAEGRRGPPAARRRDGARAAVADHAARGGVRRVRGGGGERGRVGNLPGHGGEPGRPRRVGARGAHRSGGVPVKRA